MRTGTTDTMVWYGNMEHGTFRIGDDESPIVIINFITERLIVASADVERYMETMGYDSYLIPNEFKGMVVFSRDFFSDLKGLL
jgi:hypothetical protein